MDVEKLNKLITKGLFISLAILGVFVGTYIVNIV